MAYYYIKSGGTATGDAGRYATKQTGSFAALGAANYYADLDAAEIATTPPTSGDFACVSDAHNRTEASTTINYGVAPADSNLPFTTLSVSDTAIDTYSKATSPQESSTGSQHFYLNSKLRGRKVFEGMFFSSARSIQPSGDSAVTVLRNCILRTTTSGDQIIYMEHSGGVAELYETELQCNGSTASSPFYVRAGINFKMFGGSITTDQSGINKLITGGGDNSGATLYFVGVDVSAVTASLLSVGSSSATDSLLVRFDKCTLNASLTAYLDITPTKNVILELYGCGSGPAAEYQFYRNHGGNIAEEDTTFYRDSSTAFPSGQKVSIKVDTIASVQPGYGFWFELPVRAAALSNASTDTIRVYLLSSDSGLTDQDIYCELLYPDGTNIHIHNFLTTKPDNLLAAGTALTANSDAWTGRTTETRYQIDLDTSGDVGADGVPIVRIHVCKPSITVYFDAILGVVA